MEKLKVVVVDDELIIREGIRNYIQWEELGMKVVKCAKNGEEALETLLNDDIDIVISDIRMPKMDGLSLVRKLVEHNKRTSIIFISGYSDFSYAQQAIQLDIVEDYIVKPVDPEQLMESLKKCKEKKLRSKATVILPSINNLEVDSLINNIDFKITPVKDKILLGVKRGDFSIVKNGWDELNKIFIDVDLKEEFISSYYCSLILDLIYILMENNVKVSDVFKFEDPIRVFAEINDKEKLKEKMEESLIKMCESMTDNKQIALSPIIYKTVEMIDKKYMMSNFSLQFVAEQMLVTPNYLSTKFKEEMGIGFAKYLNNKRIDKAKELLADATIKVYEVSYKIGLEDVRYFTRLFKEYTEMTPKEFRKLVK